MRAVDLDQVLSIWALRLADLAVALLVEVAQLEWVLLVRVHLLEEFFKALGPAARVHLDVARHEVLLDQIVVRGGNGEGVPFVLAKRRAAEVEVLPLLRALRGALASALPGESSFRYPRSAVTRKVPVADPAPRGGEEPGVKNMSIMIVI